MTTHHRHDHWQSRWRERDAEELPPADPWLQRVLPLLPPGRALDLACGNGRNALFLAACGYAVTAVDFSSVALAQLQATARARALEVATLQHDLEAAPPPLSGSFDLIVNFYYLHRPLLAQLAPLLRPGGVLVLRTFSAAGPFPGGGDNPDYVLQPGELPRLLHGWRLLIHEEGLEPSHKGGGLAGVVARRPVVCGESLR